ncbi:hypothetical protein VP1G_05502 [Cytospora mali]|uniref:Uncharacterized protein n=1 Tax=Cytospora mali TaxID=578113 RepID=A0A194V2R7_CYTMA|nr:hypothetical protein VP1G_05502 [Valsa mali var. pyri (nom. inval.)]
MAWRKSQTQASPSVLRQAYLSDYPSLAPAPEERTQLIPLVLVFTVVAGLAFVGYHIYQSLHKVKGTVSERMGKKNVVWTKDGVKVGVKHVESEREVDTTQKYFVNAWNLRKDKERNNGKKQK